MRFHRLIAAASTALVWCTAASAQSAGCAALAGAGFGSPTVIGTLLLTNQPLDAGEMITISGDSSSIGWGLNGSTPVIAGPFAASPAAPFTETITIGAGGEGRLEIFAAGASVTFTNLNVTCVAPAAGTGGAVGTVTEIAATAQGRALRFSLDRALRDRFDGGVGPAVSQGGIFASSQGLSGGPGQVEFNPWVSLDVRSYNGTFDGTSADVIIGGDWFIGDQLLVGVLAGLGRIDLDGDGTQADADSVLFGGYVAGEPVPDLRLDGYLAVGQAEYSSGGTRFDTDRVFAGASVTGSLDGAGLTIEPRARIDGVWEDFPTGAPTVPGGTARQITAALGGQVTWDDGLGATDLAPFVSLDMEYGAREAADGTDSDFFAPRLGLGVSGPLRGGAFSAGIDAGHTTDDTRDFGAYLNYGFSF
ncbi:MAG: autotransporter outer membrane beta-barrel domain-containing protein [Pseudomonadota bacterium]